MSGLTDFAGLAGLAAAVSVALLLFPQIARLSRLRQAALLASLFAVMLIPLGEMPLAAYLRGATGDLSITTLVLLWRALQGAWYGCDTDETMNRRMLLALVALAAVVFYPLALGWGYIDPYRLGYGDPLFVAVLMLVALAAWIWKYHLTVVCIALATCAWAIGVYESDNLWDYMLDPWVSLYALGAMAWQMKRKPGGASSAHIE